MQRVAREELLRFGLLITLTIALATVAFRIDSQSSSAVGKRMGGPVARPAAGASPSVLPTAATRLPGAGAGAGGSHSAVGGSAGRPGSLTGPAAAGEPVLPVTGWDGTVRLVGLALVLIGGGASLRVAASAQRR